MCVPRGRMVLPMSRDILPAAVCASTDTSGMWEGQAVIRHPSDPRLCMLCHHTCAACNGLGPNNCTACKPGLWHTWVSK